MGEREGEIEGIRPGGGGGGEWVGRVGWGRGNVVSWFNLLWR